MRVVLDALRTSFSRPRDWAVFFVAALGIFSFLVLLPVWTTPGDDVRFQLSLLTPDLFAIMVSIATLNGALLMLHLQIRRERAGSKAAVRQAATGLAALSSGILATIGCASCYSSILAVFGLGGTAFIVEHRWWFAAVSILLTLFAIWSTARRLERACPRCAI